MKDVLYVPSLKENLFSVKHATLNGMAVHFEEQTATISKRPASEQNLMIEAQLDGSLFRFRSLQDREVALITNIVNTLETRHRRFGQQENNAIKYLVGEGLATGIELDSCSNHNKLCECCVRGKLTQKLFKPSTSLSKKPLDLIHSDLCGPMKIPSSGGNRYILTLIDDFSRHTTIYFLKSKDQVVTSVKEFVAHVSTKFGQKPKAL